MTLRYNEQGIAIFDNGLSDHLCDEIWNFYYDNISESKPGRTISGHKVDKDGKLTKNTLDQDFVNSNSPYVELRALIDDKIYHELCPVVSEYLSMYSYLAEAPNIKDTGYLWQMYRQNNGYYKEHIDGSPWVEAVFSRVGAIICYINTVDEGGETYFRYQNLKVKPQKGVVVIFPSSWMYPHEALMPISSDKLILSSFLEFTPSFHIHQH